MNDINVILKKTGYITFFTASILLIFNSFYGHSLIDILSLSLYTFSIMVALV